MPLPDYTAILNEAEWEQPYTLGLDERDTSIVAILDKEDYRWAIQWRWLWMFDKRGRKRYATRATRKNGAPIRIFLHKEITLRAYGPPPDYEHTMGDHGNGDSLDCRRANLSWATPKMNRRTSKQPLYPDQFKKRNRL